MRIYITDLEAYNNGYLIGAWYTLPMTTDELAEAIENVLYNGRNECGDSHHHEEYFITDWECDYKDIQEYDDPYELNDLAEKMQNLDEEQQAAVKLMLENYIVNDIDSAIEHLDDIHNTGQTSMEDVAIEYVDSTGALEAMPSNMRYYFDYESLGSDMEIDGTYITDDEGYYWEYVA